MCDHLSRCVTEIRGIYVTWSNVYRENSVMPVIKISVKKEGQISICFRESGD